MLNCWTIFFVWLTGWYHSIWCSDFPKKGRRKKKTDEEAKVNYILRHLFQLTFSVYYHIRSITHWIRDTHFKLYICCYWHSCSSIVFGIDFRLQFSLLNLLQQSNQITTNKESSWLTIEPLVSSAVCRCIDFMLPLLLVLPLFHLILLSQHFHPFLNLEQLLKHHIAHYAKQTEKQ